MKKFVYTLLLLLGVALIGRSQQDQINRKTMENIKYKKATFGNGCFWCTEAIFSELKGVISVTPGYSGGSVKNPTYKEVCDGTTGHAEVIQVEYNPEEISFSELLEVFWKTHDPTTLNRQGADVGTQYRSAIFFHDRTQEEEALKYKLALQDAEIWNNPIVTEITAFSVFYPAEEYHNNYFKNNPANGYCNFVITPKLEKFRKVFADKLK